MRTASGDTQQLMWMWGEVQKALGRLEGGQLAIAQRQGDTLHEMRTWRLEQRRTEKRNMGWLRHLPWDRMIFGLITLLGTLGWIKPAWLAQLRLIFGP